MGEITDKTNEALALPLISVTWSIGTIIGPLIGTRVVLPIRYLLNVHGIIFDRWNIFKASNAIS